MSRMTSVRASVAAKARRQLGLANMRRQAANRENRRIVRDEYALVIECMTNYERTRWARAGRPGHKAREPSFATVFIGPHADERIAIRNALP